MAFDPKGERLVSGSWDATLRLWEVATGKPVATLEGHTDRVTCVAFDPKGERLVSGSDDKSILLWQSVRSDGTKWQVQYRIAAAWPLFAVGAFLQGAKLSDQNKALLLQRKAKDEAPSPASSATPFYNSPLSQPTLSHDSSHLKTHEKEKQKTTLEKKQALPKVTKKVPDQGNPKKGDEEKQKKCLVM